MSIYTLKYTDTSKSPIFVYDEELDSTTLDIVLIGQSTAEYGQQLDENILHLLEHFAALESSTLPGTPDLIQAIALDHPTEGQFWFNKSTNKLFVYTLGGWVRMAMQSDMVSNSGIIAHGQQIPLPQGITSYRQCSWIVSPQYVDQESNYIECYTDTTSAIVYARYRPITANILVEGLANYLIIGTIDAPESGPSYPLPSVPLVASNTPTPTPTITITPTLTPVAGATVTPTTTPTITPTLTITPTITTTPTITPSITPTLTPTITPSSHIFTYTFNSQLFAVSNLYDIGYNNQTLSNAPLFGDLSPRLVSGYYINAFMQIIVQGSNDNIQLVFGVTNQNGGAAPPNNLFSSISFVDNSGTYRVFESANAVVMNSSYNGDNNTTWTWANNAGVFFNQNANYILVISL